MDKPYIKMKTLNFFYLLILISTAASLFSSCSQESDDFIPEPVITLEVKNYGDGVYLLDATDSEAADQIKWFLPGVIDDANWEQFGASHAKAVTLPDLSIDYELTVTIRNPKGEVEVKEIIKATQLKDPDTYSGVAP